MKPASLLAPEQIENTGEVDHRADIYSLGVVFYELLTGGLPVGRFPPPSEKAEVASRLGDVVLRTLEKEPDRRYQQASELKTEVENAPKETSVFEGVLHEAAETLERYTPEALKDFAETLQREAADFLRAHRRAVG